MEITYHGSWTWEVYPDQPIVGLFPPQSYPFEPVCAVWICTVSWPRSRPEGYSRIAEENDGYFAEAMAWTKRPKAT